MGNNRHKHSNKVPPFKPALSIILASITLGRRKSLTKRKMKRGSSCKRTRISRHKDIRCTGAGLATNGTSDIRTTMSHKYFQTTENAEKTEILA